jgi:hypothetical protein
MEKKIPNKTEKRATEETREKRVMSNERFAMPRCSAGSALMHILETYLSSKVFGNNLGSSQYPSALL